MNTKTLFLFGLCSSVSLVGCISPSGEDSTQTTQSSVAVPQQPPVVEDDTTQPPVVEDDNDTAQPPVVEDDTTEISICTVVDTPRYGTVSFGDTWTAVVTKFDTTNNRDFTVNLAEGQYGVFVYPAALGEATFYDRQFLDIEGGWDGATWGPEGAIGSTYEPVVAVIDGEKWFVYRTDFPSLGERTFGVSFANAGLSVGASTQCDVSSFQLMDSLSQDIDVQEIPEPQIPEQETSTGTCTVSDYARVGRSISNITESSGVGGLQSTASTSNQSITLDLSSVSDYGYFAYPAALGEAVFVDTDINIAGGWDGATWPDDGSIGTSYTPIVIRRDGTDWFVYRTDFPGIGHKTFNVTFDNSDLSVGDSVPCDLSAFPRIDTVEIPSSDSSGFVSGDPELSYVLVYDTGVMNIPLAVGAVSNGEWSIDVSALADGQYVLYFATSLIGGVFYGPDGIEISNGKFTMPDTDVSQWPSINN